MKKSSTVRIAFFLGLLSLSALPGANCGNQSNPNISGPSTGSGPSSDVAVMPGSGATWSAGGNPASAFTSSLRDQINAYRQGKGLHPLSLHDGINAAAELHDKDMNTRSFFSIVNPDGVDPYQRLVSSTPRIDFDNAFAFVSKFTDVNSTASDVFNALLENTASLNVIENPRVTHLGGYRLTGAVYGTWIFVENARP